MAGTQRRVHRWCGTITPGVKEASLPRGTLGKAYREARVDQVNARVEIPGVRRKVTRGSRAWGAGWGWTQKSSEGFWIWLWAEGWSAFPSPETTVSYAEKTPRGQGKRDWEASLEWEGTPFHPQRLGHRHMWSRQLSGSASAGEGGSWGHPTRGTGPGLHIQS